MSVHYHKQLYVHTCHTYVVGLSDSSQITIMITSCKLFMIRNTGMTYNMTYCLLNSGSRAKQENLSRRLLSLFFQAIC